MGGWLFGKGNANTNPPATRLRIQSSIQGAIKPIVWGQTRISGNLIDYLDFASQTQSNTGGKGGVAGVGGKGGSSGTTYSATVLVGLCEGPISAVVGMWSNKAFSLTASQMGFGIFNGAYSQLPWSYLQSAHPTHALNYRGLAYGAAPFLQLGTSPELPQFGFEVLSTVSFAYSGTNNPNAPPTLFQTLYVHGYPEVIQGTTPLGANSAVPDANPRDVIVDFLTNAHYGVGWPVSRLDTVMNDFSSACLALGLVISPALIEAKDGNAFLQEIADACNAGFRWSNGQLSIVPWYDTAITSGSTSNITTTFSIPTPLPLPNGTQQQPVIVVGLGNFVSNVSVRQSGGGFFYTQVPFTAAGTLLTSGHYYVNPSGVYVFAIADEGASVDITYVSAAQASYQPNTTPIYDISDFLPNQGGGGAVSGEQAITAVRTPTYYQYNSVKLEWLDRNNNYDPSVVEVKDQAAIDAFVLRSRDIKQTHMFCLGASATMSATLQLQREKIPNVYTFTVGPQYILLEVEDIVTLTRAVMGLNKQPVRITEIQENSDDSLTITAEEFMGTVGPPLYGSQFPTGIAANYNADPGNINTPWIFEPPDALTQGLQIWGAVSGVNEAVWGGANVWASYDGVNFSQIGTITGPARMGVTTLDLPSVTRNMAGATIDAINTLNVNLSESGGTLLSASATDLAAFNSKCWVGSAVGNAMPGEVIAYQTAVLTGPNAYTLATLNRGGYGSTIADHPAGVPFARLDTGIFSFPFDQTRIGSTVFFKFQSFNVWGGGVQDLAHVAAVTYTITGAALTSPLPDVQNVRTYFEAGFMKIYWDEITDFRNGIVYEIRKGSTWNSALTVGVLAHPPFVAFGNDTFLIRARCQPVANLIVYSADASSISIQGNVLTPNIIKTWDEQATSWPGSFTTGLVKQGMDPSAVLTLNFGVSTGTYTVPDNHIIDIGYVAAVSMNASWVGTGAPTSSVIPTVTSNVGGGPRQFGENFSHHWVGHNLITRHNRPLHTILPSLRQGGDNIIIAGANILTIADFLSQPDILSSAQSAQYVDVHLEIAVSQLSITDVYGLADAYGVSDIYSGLTGFSAWQKFVPGVYSGRTFGMRAVLTTISPQTTAPYLLAFKWQAIVPPRIDHYQNQAVPGTAGGLTITFQPDGASVAGAFNFGPNGNTTPYVSITILNPQSGDLYNQIALSLTSLQFNITNGGSPVARNVNVTVEGA